MGTGRVPGHEGMPHPTVSNVLFLIPISPCSSSHGPALAYIPIQPHPIKSERFTTDNKTTQTEPTEWEIKITDGEREVSVARELLKTANEDLELDSEDETAKTTKTKSERVVDRWPFLHRYYDAMNKWEKEKKNKTSSSAKEETKEGSKEEEYRLAAENCEKTLKVYDDKADGKGGKDGKDAKDIKKE